MISGSERTAETHMLLKLENLTKIYSVRKGFMGRTTGTVRAVDDVSLAVNAGESLGLVGESGCGKTTLARILLKLITHDAGQIEFDGEDCTRVKGTLLREYRRHVQMVFQDPYSSLDPRVPIREILREGLILDEGKFTDDKQRDSHIRKMLSAVNLKSDILSRYPHEFSGGERQRIAIARSLMLSPRLLVLDEAVSSLDVIVQEQILELLKDLQTKFNLTYIFISHNLKAVKRLSHRIAVMARGRIVELAPSKKIFESPRHPYTRELLAAAVEYKALDADTSWVGDTDAAWTEVDEQHFVRL